MKKTLILSCLLLFVFTYKASGQYEDFQERSNLVVFSGLVDRLESDQLGWYYGVYVDYLIYKSLDSRWSFGPYGLISRSDYHYDNQSALHRALQYGGGISLGYYEPNFSFKHQSFIGFSLGLSTVKEKQEVFHDDGLFEAWQKDMFLNGNINFNLLKVCGINPNLFPRSQIQLRWNTPLESTRTAYWNSKPITTSIWDKGYLEVIAKQNLYQSLLSWKGSTLYSPKLVGFYSHSNGDDREFYGLGLEISLFKEYRDDFLSLGFLYKESPKFKDEYFIISLNLNFSSLFRK